MFIDLLADIWGSLLFWEIVDDNERAVLLRLGDKQYISTKLGVDIL